MPETPETRQFNVSSWRLSELKNRENGENEIKKRKMKKNFPRDKGRQEPL